MFCSSVVKRANRLLEEKIKRLESKLCVAEIKKCDYLIWKAKRGHYPWEEYRTCFLMGRNRELEDENRDLKRELQKIKDRKTKGGKK